MKEQREPVYYVDGEFVPQSLAKISVDDFCISRGYAIFEYFRTYSRIPFHLEDHLERFLASAKYFCLKHTLSKERLIEITEKLLAFNPDGELGVKILLTGGASTHYIRLGSKPCLIFIVTPLVRFSEKYYTSGGKMESIPFQRFLPFCKHTHYARGVRAFKEVTSNETVDILYRQKQRFSETITANFFLVSNGKLITARSNILPGITRKIVLELAHGLCPIHFAFPTLSMLATCDEAFITSTNKGVMPIVQIDEQIIGAGVVGPFTKKMMHLFSQHIEKVKKRLFQAS